MTLNRTNWKNTRDRLLQINSVFWSSVIYVFLDWKRSSGWLESWLIGVLLRILITQMIFFNQGMLLLGSNHVLGYRGFQLPMANYSKCMKEVQSGETDVGSSYRQWTEHRINQGTEFKIGVSLWRKKSLFGKKTSSECYQWTLQKMIFFSVAEAS